MRPKTLKKRIKYPPSREQLMNMWKDRFAKIQKKSKPLVSVIITTMPGREKLIARAIASIKRQTYKNIETIVMVGGSDVQVERNKGAHKAKGDFLFFLDDDDEFYARKIEEQVKIMLSKPNVTLCICWGKDYKFGLFNIIKPKEHWTFTELIQGFNISCTSAFCVRRSSFDSVGGFTPKLHDNHEYDLALKLSCIGEVYCIQKVLCRFNDSGSNWSNDFAKKIRGQFQFISIWKDSFNAIRWIKTLACLMLFSIGLISGQSVHKLFNMTKKWQEDK